jgi:hypothetical protein
MPVKARDTRRLSLCRHIEEQNQSEFRTLDLVIAKTTIDPSSGDGRTGLGQAAEEDQQTTRAIDLGTGTEWYGGKRFSSGRGIRSQYRDW